MINGTGLHLSRFGAGPPLLLVHGALVTGAMFDPLVPYLAGRFDLIIPDLRGHGASADLPPPYTVERHAVDLTALIEDLGIERLSVLGCSQGGAVAQ
jgi:pimeloyl-ACP methyl ester carboxylesterase